jgi:hypothetical protein
MSLPGARARGRSGKTVVAEMRARPRRERDLQVAILQLLRARGFPVWKVGSGAFRDGDRYIKMGQVGMSDLIGILPPHGRLLAVEVKRVGAKPTPEQAAFLEIVREAGGKAFVARGCEDVIRELGL